MSLDLMVLDEKGFPDEVVSLGVDEHAELMEQSRRKGLALILRMEDYYEDAEYHIDELDGLREELAALIDDETSSTPEHGGVLRAIIALADLAEQSDRPIVVACD